MRTSYWNVPEPDQDIDQGLPLYEPLDWFHTADHGYEGVSGRLDWVEELDQHEWRIHVAQAAGIDGPRRWSPEQHQRFVTAICHLEEELENQAFEHGIIGYHDHGAGVIEAHMDEFLAQVGYEQSVAQIVAAVAYNQQVDTSAAEMADTIRRSNNVWEQQPADTPPMVMVARGQKSPVSASVTVAERQATVTQSVDCGGITVFADSAGAEGYALSRWHNERIPESLRTIDGVYSSPMSAVPLEKQPGNDRIVEAVFAKELIEYAQDPGVEREKGRDVGTTRAHACAMIRNEDPAAWQHAYGETPILEPTPGIAPPGMGAPQGSETLIGAPEGYHPCSVGQLREAISTAGRGHVHDYLARQRSAPDTHDPATVEYQATAHHHTGAAGDGPQVD